MKAVSSAAFSRASVAPGRSRAMTRTHQWSATDTARSRKGESDVIGTKNSCTVPGRTPLNPRGKTPMIVRTDPFSVNVWPTALGSCPNRRPHRSKLITTWAAASASPGANSRPATGRTPSAGKKLSETTIPPAENASARVRTTASSTGAKPNTSATSFAASFSSAKVEGETDSAVARLPVTLK